MAQSPIAELLSKVGLLDERQVDAVMSRTNSPNGGHVVQQVSELGYASESAVARAISIELGLPRIDLSLTPPEPDALPLLEGPFCLDRLVLPVALRENGELLWLAMADPTDSETMSLVRRKTQKRVRPAVAGPSEIIRMARQHYGVQMPRISSARSENDMGAIELSTSGEHEPIEIVNVMDESASPLARIARQLGVQVPATLARSTPLPGELPPVELPPDGGPPPEIFPPLPPPEQQRSVTPLSLQPVAPAQRRAQPDGRASHASRGAPDEVQVGEPVTAWAETARAPDELGPDELATLEAIRASMEKSAHVLKTLVSLCVEKGVFTREEMARRGRGERDK